MESDNGHRSVYYKDKAAYNQALLDAIKDARKQRVDDPGRGFPNAVLALENIIFSDERKLVNIYKFDPSDHKKEIDEAFVKAKAAFSKEVAAAIFLNEIKLVSWPMYRNELKNLLDKGLLPDLNFDDTIDRLDARILLFEALLSKIIYILQDGGWLTWEAEGDIAGGGGSGLSVNGPADAADDDLSG